MRGELRELLGRLGWDFAAIGIVGGVAAGIWRGEEFGFSFAAGCLWLGLSIVLLGLLIGALIQPGSPSKLAVSLLACAKILLAFILLPWLLSRPFIEPFGIVAAMTTLPVVILFRGLAGRKAGSNSPPLETTRKDET